MTRLVTFNRTVGYTITRREERVIEMYRIFVPIWFVYRLIVEVFQLLLGLGFDC